MKSEMISPNQKITRRKDGSLDVATINNEPSMTQQQWKDECDINNIIKTYVNTGEFRNLTSKTGVYADFSDIQDYHSMQNQIIEAQHAFNTLPAQIRSRFANDPGQLINFLQDPKNKDEAIKLGLMEMRSSSTNANQNPNQNANTQPNATSSPSSSSSTSPS